MVVFGVANGLDCGENRRQDFIGEVQLGLDILVV